MSCNCKLTVEAHSKEKFSVRKPPRVGPITDLKNLNLKKLFAANIDKLYHVAILPKAKLSKRKHKAKPLTCRMATAH